MECGLAWSLLLSTTLYVTKCCGLTRPIRAEWLSQSDYSSSITILAEFLLKLDRNIGNIIPICFRKHRDEKKENNLLTVIINNEIVFAWAIIMPTA